ncbi:hypothetical protein AGMMS49982_00700 [Bacteroidia bacterium]|nr:hypothetical protein AGMMS49982_00700 [Bacteroidia bacterium]
MESQLVLIQNKIFAFRNQKVMLDRDLAQLYGVETKKLNQAVKRNIERFPEDFMFQLTDEECSRSQFVTLNEVPCNAVSSGVECSRSQIVTLNKVPCNAVSPCEECSRSQIVTLNKMPCNAVSSCEECSRSQFVTLNKGRGSNIKYAPYAFTELGIAMLSSVLTSQTAIEVNMRIMRAFVAVRQFLAIPPAERLTMLEYEVKRLATTIDDTFADYNNFSEDTRTQLGILSKSLVELQEAKNNTQKPSPIGYIAIAQARAEAEKANKNKNKKTKKNKKTT